MLKLSILLTATLVLAGAVTATAQANAFSDPGAEYTFSLPDAKWKQIGKVSNLNPGVEYLYGDRRSGALEIRKLSVNKDDTISDVIRDQEQKLQFMPGYVAGKQESFQGKVRGAIFNFEYVHSAQPMSGRYYFLRPNETTVYVMRFSGEKDSLRSIQNQTDQIARSFAIK
jgi:hypothetical protein